MPEQKLRQINSAIRSILFSGCLLLSVMISSCVVSGENEPYFGRIVPPSKDVMRYVSGPEPESLDPQVGTGQVEQRIYLALYEGLVEYDPQTLEPIPAIAERWETNSDSTEYTFYLRKNAKWSNGEPITARDFVYTMRRGLDPKFASAHSNLGAALMEQGKQDEAIACYRKVIELDPKSAEIHNSLAWLLATSPEEKFRDPAGAVELAMKAIELDPQQGGYWNTLGVARYRVGDWNEGIHALKQSNELMKGESFSFNAFFLAMAHWQLDEKDEAGKWYKQAVDWMEKNQPENEELGRFRAEAAELLGIVESMLPAAEPAVN